MWEGFGVYQQQHFSATLKENWLVANSCFPNGRRCVYARSPTGGGLKRSCVLNWEKCCLNSLETCCVHEAHSLWTLEVNSSYPALQRLWVISRVRVQGAGLPSGLCCPHRGLTPSLDSNAHAGLFVRGLHLPQPVTSARWAEASVPVLGESGPQLQGDAAGTLGLLPQLGVPVLLALIFVNAVFLRSILRLLDLYSQILTKETNRIVTAFRG